MKVLIAVDGSAGSQDAVAQIAPLLAAGRDTIALYYSPPELRLHPAAAGEQVLARARQSLADAILGEACKQVPEGLRATVQTIVGTKDPRHGIVAAADECGAKLIVVGARGLGALERMLLGSVSRAVAHRAKVPVWVARPKRGPRDPSWRLLLPCESPELGRPSVELLGQFNWPAGTTCRTLTVIASLFAGRVPPWLEEQARSPDVEAMVQAWAREHAEEMRSNVERMREFSQKFPGPLSASDPVVVEGEAASAILSTIATHKVDLVVVGAYRKHPLIERVFGSTSEAVLNHADCSVLIVPHHEPL